jgi:hypothetical protein
VITEKKTTLGWVVNGGRRHAGQQEDDLILRGQRAYNICRAIVHPGATPTSSTITTIMRMPGKSNTLTHVRVVSGTHRPRHTGHN